MQQLGSFLLDLKEFGRENNEIMKTVELKKVEQESKTMEKFVQELKRVVRDSGYKRRPLIEKFKQEINKIIRRKLMEAERLFKSVEQQFEQAMNLDRYLRESRKEE